MHGQKKRIWGNICLFFADEKIPEVVKRYLRLSKKSTVL